jgi:hypothetical protein
MWEAEAWEAWRGGVEAAAVLAVEAPRLLISRVGYTGLPPGVAARLREPPPPPEAS